MGLQTLSRQLACPCYEALLGADVALGQLPAELLVGPSKDRPVVFVVCKQTLVLAVLLVDPIDSLQVGVIELQQLFACQCQELST